MEIVELKSKIKSKSFPNFVIFTGPELAVQDIYIKQIAKAKNADLVQYDSIKDFIQNYKNRQLLGGAKIGGIVYDCDFIALEEKKRDEVIERINAGTDVCILRYDTIDKRTSFYKAYKDVTIDFQPLTEQALIRYIQKAINLNIDACKALIQVCESNYGRILSEIDKIKQYSEARDNRDVNRAFQELLESGTIYSPAQDVIFEWSNAVLSRNPRKSFHLMKECFRHGDSPLVMLSVLYSNLRSILQVQGCYDGSDIGKTTGLTPWQIRCVSPYRDRYSDEELIQALRSVQLCESGIKTGKVDESMAVPYALVRILGGGE